MLHINQTNISLDAAIMKFDLERSNFKVIGEVKGQGHIVHPVYNWHTSYLFHFNQNNHSWFMTSRMFDLEEIHPKILKESDTLPTTHLPP